MEKTNGKCELSKKAQDWLQANGYGHVKRVEENADKTRISFMSNGNMPGIKAVHEVWLDTGSWSMHTITV